MSARRLVVITGDGPEHRYVANRIAEAHDVTAIFVADPPLRRSWTRVLRKSPLQFFDKALWHLYLRAIGDKKARAVSLHAILGAASEVFARPDLIIRVSRPKEGRLAAEVAKVSPDVIAVFGTGIIPDVVLDRASIALNMHTGISPWYRGTACAFWPIAKGEPDKVGATVHRCTSAVDGGEIFFTRQAPLYRGDDLHAIFARAVIVGTQGYIEVLDQVLAGEIECMPQDLRLGREYRGAMRGIRAELSARRTLRRLSRDWPPAA